MPARSYYKQNRLQQLRGFCYAVQTGSISQAAERMSLSQPSVSLQIQALEKELNAILFERRGPRIQTTPEGLALYELALPLIEGFDNLAGVFQAQRSDLSHGEINIAAGESSMLYLLPERVEQFTRLYPGLRIRYHNGAGMQGLQLLRDDVVDFAVGSFRSEPPDDMNYHPIYTCDQVLIMPPQHPLASYKEIKLNDITAYKFIFPPRHLNTFSMVEMVFQQHGLTLDVGIEGGGWEVIKRYVRMGMGISIVSGICLREQDDLAQYPLGRYLPKRNYGVIVRRGKFLSAPAHRLIEHIAPSFFRHGQIMDEPGSQTHPV